MSHETPRDKNPFLTIRIVTPFVIVFFCVLAAIIALLFFSNVLSSPEQRVAEITSRNPTFNMEDTEPRTDASALTATQEALLHGYGWVDQSAGVARIPIDRAMALVVATDQTAQAEATETVTPAPSENAAAGAASTVEAASTTIPESVESGESSGGVARPSNPGDAGQAVNLKGNVQAGAQVFTANCQTCHGIDGQGGVPNPGSDDGTIPSLNPIDDTLISSDPQVYAYNLDLFVEHGSKPEGTNPQLSMPSFGDDGKLSPQQIANVIAYVMSLNPAPATPAATAEATTQATAAP